MLLKGDVEIQSLVKVWDSLIGTNQISPCAPGAEKIKTIKSNKNIEV